MKQIITSFLFFFGFVLTAKADHITGGEMFYTYQGFSNNLHQYRFTAKYFKDCFSNRQLNGTTVIVVYEKVTGNLIKELTAPLTKTETLQLGNPNKCITNPPPVCYQVGYYEFDLALPASPYGYVVACQVNFRINTITNLQSGYFNIGATYTAEVPGTADVANGAQNNSARFAGNDLVIVCAHNSFTYSFEAQDPDGDELRYSFCDAYRSSGGGGGNNTPPPSAPPYSPVPYGQGFSGAVPLSGNVRIDARTGLITGIAPSEGTYVVTVCVEEWRNGKWIAQQRKDLQIKIASCTIAAASILPEYQLCGDSKTLSLKNHSNSPLISTYNWRLTNRKGEVVSTSTTSSLDYTFADTGLYNVQLIINKDAECSDSSNSLVRVYPGFKPDFDFQGSCLNNPTTFTDKTTTVYGQVKSWHWDFGELFLFADTSQLRHPSYQYQGAGNKEVSLIVGNTLGCLDTVQKSVAIIDKPPITLAFRDTLICSKDALQLNASGNGHFSWSPQTSLAGAQTGTPTATPTSTTTYFVHLDDDGCVNQDSVRVRVTDRVSLQVMNDTTICAGDAVQLRTESDGFRFSWQPAAGLDNPGAAMPTALVQATTTYQVTAAIGSCVATEQVVVATVPYPVAQAGADTVICYHTPAQLTGARVGSSSVWSPAAGLQQADQLHTMATPESTTAYVLSVYDTQGCPKPGRDTVVVTVLPPIQPFAGRDTAIVVGQPLQFTATGGVSYAWSPAEELSAANIANPVAVFDSPADHQRFKVLVYNEAGCVDSAFVQVSVYKTMPTVFVPTAFTPNGDGRNDVLKPISAGLQRMEYFQVYNRWGKLVFSTSKSGQGWDGTVNEQPQRSDTFVWVVKGTDYTGKAYFQKGTVTLVR